MNLYIINFLICIFCILAINFILSNFKILIDNPLSSFHKNKHGKIISLSGGLYFYISSYLISINSKIDISTLIYIFPILVVGIIADIKKNFSPILRLFLQILIIIFIVYTLNITVSSVDLNFFDLFLQNKNFNLFFVVFCLVTVLNGYNLMDGLNGLVIGHFLLITISMIYLSRLDGIFFIQSTYETLKYLFLIMIIFFIFNIYEKCFLGDNGIYVLSIFLSIIIINFIENSQNKLSPIIAVNYLWYPAYENLFSIIRRLKNKKIISKPDKLHLHILINNFLLKKLNNNLKFSQINSLSSLIIILFLIPNFIFCTLWFDQSIKLTILVIIQIFIYTILYFKLTKNYKK